MLLEKNGDEEILGSGSDFDHASARNLALCLDFKLGYALDRYVKKCLFGYRGFLDDFPFNAYEAIQLSEVEKLFLIENLFL